MSTRTLALRLWRLLRRRLSASRSSTGFICTLPCTLRSTRSRTVFSSFWRPRVSGKTLTPIFPSDMLRPPSYCWLVAASMNPARSRSFTVDDLNSLVLFCVGSLTCSLRVSRLPLSWVFMPLSTPASRYVSLLHLTFSSDPSSSARHVDSGSVFSRSTMAYVRASSREVLSSSTFIPIRNSSASRDGYSSHRRRSATIPPVAAASPGSGRMRGPCRPYLR